MAPASSYQKQEPMTHQPIGSYIQIYEEENEENWIITTIQLMEVFECGAQVYNNKRQNRDVVRKETGVLTLSSAAAMATYRYHQGLW